MRLVLNEADDLATAQEVEAICAAVEPVLQKRDHYPSALALTLMAAHHVECESAHGGRVPVDLPVRLARRQAMDVLAPAPEVQ